MAIGRRTFLAWTPLAALRAQSPAPAGPVPLSSDLVKEWILKAHRRQVEPLQALLAKEPALLQSSWDWGSGDFESAMQAAGHMGNREIALFLIDRGARMDLFAATMLGELAMLKTAVERFPATLKVRGAHGIPLLSHAVAGEEHARSVMDYLLSQGVDVNARANSGGTSLMLAVQRGNREAVSLLLSKGADTRIKTPDGTSALSLAIKRGDREIVEALKQAGAAE